MKLIIDIPNNVYDHACSRSEDSSDEYTAMRAIAKGIPLPKGHGRLIDIDRLEPHDEYDGQGFTKSVYKDDIDNLPTIIEADKESEET